MRTEKRPENRSDKDIGIMVGTTQSAYAKRLENNGRVPPHLDDICAADAAIGGRKRGRRERLLCASFPASEKEAQVRSTISR